VLFLNLKGSQLVLMMFLIAATALQHSLLIITANQREFDRVLGLGKITRRSPALLA
jgi:tRNA(fMet)-specific endonuclease VapC